MKTAAPLVLLAVFFLGTVRDASSLTVTLDDNYPPYSFRDAAGRSQGILVDLWQLWSEKMGVPVTLKPLPWSQALASFDRGEADVLDTVFETPTRDVTYDFTPPYTPIPTTIFFREGLAGITRITELKGYLVGIKAGDAGADALRGAGIGDLREYPSYEALIDAAARGEIHVFCMDEPPALHFLYAKGLSREFRKAFVLAEDSFRRAVLKGHLTTLALVNQGFGKLTPNEIRTVTARWVGTSLSSSTNAETFAVAAIVCSVVIVLLGGVVFSLRRQIKKRLGQLAGAEAQLRKSEDWGRAVVETLPDLLFILDSTGLVLECRTPLVASEFRDAEAYVGKRLSEAFPPETADLAVRRMAEVERDGGVAMVEVSLFLAGRQHTYEARLSRLSDGRFLAIVRDVTDTQRAWRDDLQRNKLESLAVLAGGLAHDFNNSLAVIQGFVSLARLQLTHPEKALASLDKAVQATRRAAGLTSQLRVLAHGSEVHRQTLSVKDLAEEAAAFALLGSPCLLAVEAGVGPWFVDADPDQLSQVFHNLVLNAVQAMPRGGTVTLVFRRSAPQRLSVSVVDEGNGIPADELPRIFDPYFTTKPKGTGLGLSVVHAVVERHGGTLEVDSRVGRGTVFTVSLAASSSRPREAAAGEVPSLPELKGQRALIMEDEADLRDLIIEVLRSLGMEAQAYRNGRDAAAAFDVALAERRPFSLVVSDLLVPGDMGGREMITLLRGRGVPFRALAVTGFSTERSSDDFHNQGFDVIVGKPFTVDELKTRIVELMKTPWKTAPNT